MCSINNSGRSCTFLLGTKTALNAVVVAAAFFVLFNSGCVTESGSGFDAGPIVAVDTDVHGNQRMRALGPLVETRRSSNGMQFKAVRPFYSRVYDPVKERSIADIVWPIGMWKRRFGELDWRMLPAWGHDYDTAAPDSRYRWTLFPLLFGGRSIDKQTYFAVFPFGGVLRDFGGRDLIRFFMFPLYSHSVQDDNDTHTVLWPVFSITKGDDVYRRRFFPFYGYSHNEGRWTKRFILWPFWTSVKYEYPDQKGGGFILWPLIGHARVGDSYFLSFLPPFFKYEKGANGHRSLFCPWPFIRYKHGDVNQLYLWPLWGRRSSLADRKWFFLWPLVQNRNIERIGYSVHRFHVFPFVAYESRTAEKDVPKRGYETGDVFGRYFKLWPLFSYERRQDVVRFRSAALWPMRNPAAVDRSWAPLWNLFRYERDGGERETEFLWGLYRHRRGKQGRRLSVFPILQFESAQGDGEQSVGRRGWSLLYGLVGYRRDGLHKEIKLIYFIKFRWGRSESAESGDGCGRERDRDL